MNMITLKLFVSVLIFSFLISHLSLEASSAWTDEEYERLRERQTASATQLSGQVSSVALSAKEEEALPSLLQCPDEVLLHIAGYLDWHSLEALRATCYRLWGAVNTFEKQPWLVDYTRFEYRSRVKTELSAIFSPPFARPMQLLISKANPELYEEAFREIIKPGTRAYLTKDFLALSRKCIKNPASLFLLFAYKGYFLGNLKTTSSFYIRLLNELALVKPEDILRGVRALEAGDHDFCLGGKPLEEQHYINRALLRLSKDQQDVLRENWSHFRVDESLDVHFTKRLLNLFVEGNFSPQDIATCAQALDDNRALIFKEGMRIQFSLEFVEGFVRHRFSSSQIGRFFTDIEENRLQLFDLEGVWEKVQLMVALMPFSSEQISIIAQNRWIFFRYISGHRSKNIILKALEDAHLNPAQIIEFAAALNRNRARLFLPDMTEEVRRRIIVEMARYTGTQIDFIARSSSGYIINFLGAGALGTWVCFSLIDIFSKLA